MSIKKLDSNFIEKLLPDEEIDWIEIPSNRVLLKGVYYDNQKGCFIRLPEEVASKVGSNIVDLSKHTSGGRLLFETNSPFIALKGIESYMGLTSNMTLFNLYGFGVYQGGKYIGTILPQSINFSGECEVERGGLNKPLNDEGVVMCGYKPCKFKSKKFTINFPLYSGVKNLYLGVKKGSYVKPTNTYKDIPPIIFYGSSVTQGACASRPGLDYAGLISAELKVDYINLGFAGGCNGDHNMVDYMASLDSSLIVSEYDFNSSLAQLTERHLSVYQNIRKQKPNLPIIFMSRASCDYYPDAEERRKVIENTIAYALERGDKNVYYIDGRKLFGNRDRTACTADTCHPSDLGFYRMAKAIIKVIKENNII